MVRSMGGGSGGGSSGGLAHEAFDTALDTLGNGDDSPVEDGIAYHLDADDNFVGWADGNQNVYLYLPPPSGAPVVDGPGYTFGLHFPEGNSNADNNIIRAEFALGVEVATVVPQGVEAVRVEMTTPGSYVHFELVGTEPDRWLITDRGGDVFVTAGGGVM